MKKQYKKNVISSLLVNISNIIIGFFAQRFFLQILNAEYLGLNGLFSNIISMLAIFELGIGSAITFSLYKPLASDDKKTIKALMRFYRKAYRIIATIVFVAGCLMTTFLPYIIKEVTIDVNIYAIYLMFVLDAVCSYLLTYRRSILYADQNNYLINYVHICYLMLMNVAQLSLLAVTHNYYLYLGVKIVMRVVENLVIHLIVHYRYPYLDDIGGVRLNKKLEKDILKKIKALLFHKIGAFIVLGSDNIIISKYIGLVEVGLYSNYYLIFKAGETLIGQAVSSLTPTVGHKLAVCESEKTYGAFKKTRFAGFCLSCVAATTYMACMQPLVKIWLGEQYILEPLALAMLALNLFQRLQRYSYNAFKEAAGVYYEDRYVPIIESFLNIVVSIVLLQFFGLAGVVMGTTISGLVLWCYSYPKFVYKKLFKRSYCQYARETIGYMAVFAACATVVNFITAFVTFSSILAQLIVNAVVSFVICAIIITVTLHKTSSFRLFVRKLLFR